MGHEGGYLMNVFSWMQNKGTSTEQPFNMIDNTVDQCLATYIIPFFMGVVEVTLQTCKSDWTAWKLLKFCISGDNEWRISPILEIASETASYTLT